jgi:hypothetical protein
MPLEEGFTFVDAKELTASKLYAIEYGNASKTAKPSSHLC